MKVLEGYISNGDTLGIAHALKVTRENGFTPTLRALDRALVYAERQNDEKLKHLIRRELMAAGHRFGIQKGLRGGYQGFTVTGSVASLPQAAVIDEEQSERHRCAWVTMEGHYE